MPYRYKCVSCNEWHEGFPDITADRPLPAMEIAPQDVVRRLRLSSDLCSIDGHKRSVQTHKYVSNVMGHYRRFAFNVGNN